ncbi:MAG: thioredoxin fold domain-containing protein [Elusimicrobiota bacterium]
MTRLPALAVLTATLMAFSSCKKQDTGYNLELLDNPSRDLLVNEILVIKPAAGHHFELKAPQRCGDSPFLTRSPRVMRCQMLRPGTHRVHASVCDDKKSYCKFAEFDVRVKGSAPARASAARPEERPSRHAEVPGFILNDPEKAASLALKEDKPLFIGFHGIWCPPCNMLEEEVYGGKAFQDATQGFVRVLMDADSGASWDWKAHFKIGGYPTIVVATPKLEEVSRLVGYRPPSAMARWCKKQYGLRREPVEASTDRKRLGLWRFERAEYDEAIRLLSGLKDREARLQELEARRKKAAQETDSAAELEALRSLVDEFPEDLQYASRVTELFDADKESARKKLASALEGIRRWAGSKKLAETEYTLGDLYSDEASLLETAGETERAKDAYLRAADAFGRMASGSARAVARGANISRASALHLGGKDAEAKKLFEKLASEYSDEFTFHFSYAKLLYSLKDYGPAHAQVLKAEENSYGDNWLRTVELKARIELAMGKPAQAADTARKALREAVLPRSAAVRTHRYLANLRSVLKQAETGAEGAR